MRLNNTQVVLLGMLNRGRRTGYDIKTAIDNSTRFFWGASVGGIYPELKRLGEAGLVSAETEGRRTAYVLTDSGRSALRDWLLEDATPIYELRHEGMLKLFFADTLTDGEALEVVRRMRHAHEDKAGQLQAVRPLAEREGGWPQAVRDFGEEWNAFVIAWCERTERRLSRRGR